MSLDFGKVCMMGLFADHKETYFGFEYLVQCMDINLRYATQPGNRLGLPAFQIALMKDHIQIFDKNCWRIILTSLICENSVEEVESSERDKSREDLSSQQESRVYRFKKEK